MATGLSATDSAGAAFRADASAESTARVVSAEDRGAEVDHDAEIAAAREEATSTGEPVVVDALTTPIEQTSALPDGTMQYEVSTVPVRAEQDGEWVPIETDLVVAGEWLEPAASANPVRFSAGGSDVVSQIQTASGEWVTERWPHGDLPAPDVDGPTATYEEVLPGVDLKLTATELGMASVYVVKNEAAALSAPLRDLHVDIEGADVVRNASGTFTADAGGEEPIIATSPLWWDSSNGGDYVQPGGDDPMMPVSHALTDDSVSMNVATTIGSEDVVYPVYIDPDWTQGENASWYTDAAYPNQSYLSASQSDVLRVGVSGGNVSNMFFQFPISFLSGKTIQAASLNTQQIQALYCPAGAIDLRLFGPQTAGFTWNGTNTSLWGPVIQSQNPGTCSSPSMAVGWNVKNAVASKVGESTIQFGVTYPSGSTNSRRHYDRDATLTVTYNTPPNVTTGLKFSVPNRSCGTASSPTMISASQVTVQFSQSDPDGGNVGTRVFLHKASDLTNEVTSVTTGLTSPGTKTLQLTGLTNGQTYAWRGRASDGVDTAAYSGWCYFAIDTTPPSVPTITPPSGGLTIGKPSTVSFSTVVSQKVAFIAYTVNSTATSFVFDDVTIPAACNSLQGTVRIVCPDSSGVATSTFAPTGGSSTIFALSYDAAGNRSSSTGTGTSISVTAQNDPLVSFDSAHVWLTQDKTPPLGATVPDTNSASAVGLTLGADTRRDETANPILGQSTGSKPVLKFDAPAGLLTGPAYTRTALGVVNPVQSFTVAAWLEPKAAPFGGSAAAVLSDTDQAGIVLGASDANWRFCLRPLPPEDAVCANIARESNAGWTHVAGVWDSTNSQMRLYVDGVLKTTVAFTWPSGTSTTPLVLNVGANVAGTTVNSRWLGRIADPAVLPGVASSSQISELRSGHDPLNG